MHFEVVQQVHAPLLTVEAAYVDPTFLTELRRLPKVAQPVVLEQEDRGGQLWQRVRYAYTGDLSSAVKAIVDPRQLTWVEESTLDRTSHSTDLVIRPDKYAGLLDATGRVTLASGGTDGEVTTRRTTGDIHVHVPFVGGKVEAAIVTWLRDHAEQDVDAIEQWAADRR